MSLLPNHEECHFDAHGNNIWAFLLDAEQEALRKSTLDSPLDPPQHDTPLIAIRVLGFLLKDLWDNALKWNLGDTAYSQLAEEINCICKAERETWFDELVDLGVKYRNRISRVFFSDAEYGYTPTDDEDVDPPRTKFDIVQEQILQTMNIRNGPTTTKPDVRQQALLRDGFRCVISRVCDMDTQLQLVPGDILQGLTGLTKVAYLFSKNALGGPKESPTSIFNLFAMFGLENRADLLYGGATNSLENVITLETTPHLLFDKFYLWLEPVEGQEHTYDVCCPVACQLNLRSGPLPPRITFKLEPSVEAMAAKHNVTLKFPDPQLIAIRAICARVANMSGAIVQLRQITSKLEDRLEPAELAEYGGIAALLAGCLTRI